MSKKRPKILITEHAPERAEGISELVETAGAIAQVVRLYEGERLPEVTEHDAVISGGGPMGVYEIEDPRYTFLKDEADYLACMIAQRKAVLGVCLGHQLLIHVLGGKVELSPANREIGWSKITLTPKGQTDPLFTGIPQSFWSFQYHNDQVINLPKSTENTATTDTCLIQAIRHVELPVWGVQFHPEITPEKAQRILTARRETLEQEGINVNLAIEEGFSVDHSFRKKIFYNFVQALAS